MKKILIIITLLFSLVLEAKSLDANSFYPTIKKNKLVIVKFWASWCAPCVALEYKFLMAQKVAKKRGLKVLFADYNVDLGGRPLKDYNIKYLPTLVIFKNGKEVSRTTSSSLTAEEIVDWIEEADIKN